MLHELIFVLVIDDLIIINYVIIFVFCWCCCWWYNFCCCLLDFFLQFCYFFCENYLFFFLYFFLVETKQNRIWFRFDLLFFFIQHTSKKKINRNEKNKTKQTLLVLAPLKLHNLHTNVFTLLLCWYDIISTGCSKLRDACKYLKKDFFLYVINRLSQLTGIKRIWRKQQKLKKN